MLRVSYPSNLGAEAAECLLDVLRIKGKALPGAPCPEFLGNHAVVHIAARRPLEVAPMLVELDTTRCREGPFHRLGRAVAPRLSARPPRRWSP